MIGGEPQDVSYNGAPTRLEIGHENVFREGVTVNRGAEKEDHTTRIGHQNLLMANCHVAHNCHVQNRVILVNGVLLGGHAHVHDGAIISGNCAVHHFATVGMLAFVSGGSRVPHDIPPFMLASGSDDPCIKTINLVGMRRAGMTEKSIEVIKRAHRLLYREMKPLEAVREIFAEELDGIFPFELSTLLNFLEKQRRGKLGRAREAFRDSPRPSRRAARAAEGRMKRLRVGVVGTGGAGTAPRADLLHPRHDRAGRRRRHVGRAGPGRCRSVPHALVCRLPQSFRTSRRGLDRGAHARPSGRRHGVSPAPHRRAGRETAGCEPSPKRPHLRGGGRTPQERRCRSATSSGSTPRPKWPADWPVLPGTSAPNARAPMPSARPTSASCWTS